MFNWDIVWNDQYKWRHHQQKIDGPIKKLINLINLKCSNKNRNTEYSNPKKWIPCVSRMPKRFYLPPIFPGFDASFRHLFGTRTTHRPSTKPCASGRAEKSSLEAADWGSLLLAFWLFMTFLGQKNNHLSPDLMIDGSHKDWCQSGRKIPPLLVFTSCKHCLVDSSDCDGAERHGFMMDI